MSSTRLALAAYRGLLRWARGSQEVPCQLRSTDVYGCFPAARALASLELHDASSSVSSLARLAFRHNKHLTGEGAEAALGSALQALRLLNTDYAAQLRLMRETRADKSNREGVVFDVGTVFLHKKFGYRGLIIGWDRRCTRDEDWVREANVDPAQPFYYVLPDEVDCVRLFSQPFSSRYVAQDNILALPGQRVVHRAVDHYFTSFSPALGRYIPSRKLQYEYPGVYAVEDSQVDSVAADANLLLHPEEGEGPEEQAEGEAGKGGGRGRSRRRSPFKRVNRGLGEQEAVI